VNAPPATGAARVVFLGGVGEVGRNMLAVEQDERLLVIDAGLSFPNEEMLGVDLVLPDFSYISERADRCDGIVLTHGHEDHVGALSWLLRDVDVPVYGTPLTLGIARRALWRYLPRVGAPSEVSSAASWRFHIRFRTRSRL
jgi:ribonuclease J